MPVSGRIRPAVARAVWLTLGLAVAALVVGSCDADFTAPRIDRAPRASITEPAAGATFRAGDTITYRGAGTDPEDGEVPLARTAWWVDVVRGAESFAVVPRTTGQASGTIVVPTRGDLWPEMRYRVHLEVRDRGGKADTMVRDVAPRTATMRFVTVPAGLQVTLDGESAAAPRQAPAVVASLHDVAVASPQSLGADQWNFSGWSHGAARAHTVATPDTDATYTATFTRVPPPNVAPTVALVSPTAGS